MSEATFDIRIMGSTAPTMDKKAAALERLASAIVRLNSSLKGGGGAVAVASGGIDRYTDSVTRAGNRTDRFGTSLGGARNALDNFRLLFRRMVRIMAAYLIITQLTRLTKDFVMTLAKAPALMQLWSVQLRTLYGNATLAAESLDLLKTVAIETPLELPDLFTGLVALRAFNVEISDRTLPLIADLAAVTGKTFEATAQVIGKVIQGSAPAITRSLPTMGINPAEFKALAAELGSRSEAIFQIIAQKFEGFAKESALTVLGVLSNIKDAYFVVMADVGRALVPLFARAAGGIMDWLQALRGNKQALADMAVSIRGVGESLLSFARITVTSIRVIFEFTGHVINAKGAIILLASALTAILVPAIYKSLAALGPLKAILIAVGLVVAFAVNQVDELNAPLRRAEVSAMILGERVQELQRLARININLVDANEAAEAARGLTELFDKVRDLREAALSLKIAPGVFESMVTSLKNIGDVELTSLAEQLGFAGPSGAAGIELFAQILTRIGAMRNEMGKLTFDAAAAAEALRALMVPSLGDSGFGDDAASPLKIMRSELALLKADFDSGLLGPEMYMLALSFLGSRAKNQFEEMRTSAVLETRDMAVGFWTLSEQATAAITETSSAWEDGVKAMLETTLAGVQMAKNQHALKIIDKNELAAQMTEAQIVLQAQFEALASIGGEGARKMRLAILAGLAGIQKDLESLFKEKDPVSQALETQLRQLTRSASDAIASGLAGGEDAIKLALAGVLGNFGDALIQIGLAKVAWDEIVKKIINFVPGGAAVVIAAGIALKAYAAKLAAGVGGGNSNKSLPSSRPGSGSFGTFTSSQQAPARTDVTIYALDSQSFETFVSRNQSAFATGVQAIADADRTTGGAAFGVFVPQGA